MATETTHNPTLHHINLKTVRMQQMIDWYGLVVGAEVIHRYAGGAWLSNDEANHRIALMTTPEMTDDGDKLAHTGLHHSAYEYPSIHDLLDTFSRLKAQGILPHACLDHGMTVSFYYVDPDGNSVELQCDAMGDWAAGKAFMLNSAEFAADPIGTSIDPDLMLAARDTGADRDELHERAYKGEFAPDAPLDLRLPKAATESEAA